MKKFLVFLLALSLASPNIYAEGGDKIGNGDDNPILSLNPEQQKILQDGYNLSYLKLTPKEIQQRDRKLQPIYKSYQNNTVASVANALSNAFGLNIYNHIEAPIHFTSANVNKKMLMAAAARFYVNTRYYGASEWKYARQSPLRDTPTAELGFRDSVTVWSEGSVKVHLQKGSKKRFKEEYIQETPYALYSSVSEDTDYHFFDMIESTRSALYTSTKNQLYTMPGIANFLEAMRESNLRGLDATVVFVTGPMQQSPQEIYTCNQPTQKKTFRQYSGRSSNVLRDTAGCDYKSSVEMDKYMWEALYNPLHIKENPKIDCSTKVENSEYAKSSIQTYLLLSNFKAEGQGTYVDMDWQTQECTTTVKQIFTDYQVVYPTFSKLAPIPQPVIYVNRNAKKQSIAQLLADHAPRIYAYNQLFDREVLPQVQDLNSVLQQHPNFIADVKKLAGNVDTENLQRAMQQAFLTVTYGTGLAVGAVVAVPLTLAAMLLSPLYYPLLVSTTVVILTK